LDFCLEGIGKAIQPHQANLWEGGLEHPRGVHQAGRTGVHFEAFRPRDGADFDAIEIVHIRHEVLEGECVMVLVVDLDDEGGRGACWWWWIGVGGKGRRDGEGCG
jgi:hypothetical protein